MNILFLINFAGQGGSEKYVADLVSRFQAWGHRCALCYSVPGRLSETLEQQGIPCLQLNLGRSGLRTAPKKLGEWCREHEIQVIHAQYPRENIIALRSLKTYPQPKVLYTFHLNIRVGLRWRWLNRMYTPKNHRVIAVWEGGRALLVKNGVRPDKITVIANGTEPGSEPMPETALRQELAIPEDCFTLLTLGRFTAEKGMDVLIHAVAALRQKTDKPFLCLIAGEGPLLESGKALAEKLQIGENIRFLGYREDGDRLLRLSQLYVNSSRSEALSLSVLEAMAAGLPAVLTDVGAAKILMERNGVCGTVVPSGDAEALAQAILRYMEDGERCRREGAQARKKILRIYNLDRQAQETLHAYE